MTKRKTDAEKVKSNPVGRPSTYQDEYALQAEKLCRLGATDVQLADFFGVVEKTINNWKRDHPEFLQSLKDGKEEADNKVTKSLFARANGYEHAEDKIFNNNGVPLVVPTIKHYAPDTTACIFWLKNRRPELWRDVHDVRNHIPQTFDDRVVSETNARIRKILGEGKDIHPAPILPQ